MKIIEIIVIVWALIAWLMYLLCVFSGIKDDEYEQSYQDIPVSRERD